MAQGREFVVFREMSMKHASQSQFGRPMSACQTSTNPASDTARDKWALLEKLTTAAPAFDLSHRTLGVLRALLTFLPQRIIPTDMREAVVFPSNKTLSNRLNGMPESTLRRHLAQLVKAGIVSRHDSANRKRFARRVCAAGQVAFGFDLSPMARQAEEIAEQAKQLDDHAQRNAAMRAELGQLRQQLIGFRGHCAITEDVCRAMRRKLDADALMALTLKISVEINARTSTEVSGTDDQNERHLQKELKTNSEAKLSSSARTKQPEDTTLRHLVAQCSEYQSYFPTPPRHWEDIINIANRLVPMIGIDRPVFDDAIRVIGIRPAATVVLCLLEKLDGIRNPGGYLRRITQLARAGRLDLDMLAPSRRRKLQ